MEYIKLLRPKDWAKNLFIYIPLFFAGQIANWAKLTIAFEGFLAFCCIASTIYIINDVIDREDDRKHPKKRFRPIASGKVSLSNALVLAALLTTMGFTIGYLIGFRFLSILAFYLVINLCYTFGLKNVAILDIFIIALGFVLRVRAGGAIAEVGVTVWMHVMVLLLSLFMAAGKRRDDAILKQSLGVDMRKSMKGYTIEFLNALLAVICSVMIVAYIMYSISDHVREVHQTHRLYITSVFVMAGIMRYLQIIYVYEDSGSPTKILYKDRFIQGCLLLWVVSFYFIIYLQQIQ